MNRSIQAVYEKGVLRLLEPIDLQEHQRVSVVVLETLEEATVTEWLDMECPQEYAEFADQPPALEVVRDALSKIPGSLTDDFIAERNER